MKYKLGDRLLITFLVLGLVLTGILVSTDLSLVSAAEHAYVDLMKVQVGGEPGIEWEFELDPPYGPTDVFTLEDGDVRNFPIQAGVEYTLTETPVEGYVTTYTVNGGAPQAGNSVTIGPLDADDEIVIDFINTFEEIPTYQLNMAVEPAGSGTATDVTNESPYLEGNEVEIRAEAEEGWLFVRWTAPAGIFDDDQAEETTFTMPAQAVIVTANFEEIPPATYTISGRITKDGNPLPGVSVTGTTDNPWTDTDTTDADGVYELKGVPYAATSITITPTLANHVFSPASIQLPGPVEEDVPDQDFTATSDVTPPITVGWNTHSVDKVAVLAPWLALMAAIMVGVSVIVLRRQGRSREHP